MGKFAQRGGCGWGGGGSAWMLGLSRYCFKLARLVGVTVRSNPWPAPVPLAISHVPRNQMCEGRCEGALSCVGPFIQRASVFHTRSTTVAGIILGDGTQPDAARRSRRTDRRPVDSKPTARCHERAANLKTLAGGGGLNMISSRQSRRPPSAAADYRSLRRVGRRPPLSRGRGRCTSSYIHLNWKLPPHWQEPDEVAPVCTVTVTVWQE